MSTEEEVQVQQIVQEIAMCFADEVPQGEAHKAERLLGFSERQRSLMVAFKRLGCTEAEFLPSQYRALAALGYDLELESGSSSSSKDGEGSPTLLKKVTKGIQALLKQSQLGLPPNFSQRKTSLSPVHASPTMASAPVLPQRRHTVCAPSFLLDRPKAAGLVATAVPADLFVQASRCSKHCCDTFETPIEFFPTRQEALEEENAQLKAMLASMGVDAAAAATACCTPSYYAGGTAASMWSMSVAASSAPSTRSSSSISKSRSLGGAARGRFPERAQLERAAAARGSSSGSSSLSCPDSMASKYYFQSVQQQQ
eukprot:5914-Heterococcus_DN1.PRE.3